MLLRKSGRKGGMMLRIDNDAASGVGAAGA
jgi:hypothetical protein